MFLGLFATSWFSLVIHTPRLHHRRYIIIGLLLSVMLTGSAWGQSKSSPKRRYLATELMSFELAGVNTLFMPTDVAVAPDGTVFVVDGVNDRIVQFNPDGTLRGEIRTVGAEQLSMPISAMADAQGRLWIADNGHHRILLRAEDGKLERIITPPQGTAEDLPDITNLALSSDGRILWIVDNDHHRLLRFDLETEEAKAIGELGESLGQFHYPFMLDVTPVGDVIVTDVLNGRAQIFNAAGVPVGSVGTYGVDLGQLYRPKGVALDADGNVWITDGDLNVIQIFAPGGQLLGVLGDKDGQLLRFAAPMGLTFDSSGCLYVVELRRNRVRKLRITNTKAEPPVLAPRQSYATIGQQARSCTICHLEWMKPLVDYQSTELMEVPDNPREHPFVSRSELCLGCHDGSVGDSRRRVWIRHGHQIGIEPPPTTNVPEHLPLVEGRIACRTCHSAHGLAEPRPTFEDIVFLRVESAPSELCVQCHTNYAAGISSKRHPLGKMERPIPQQLIDAGALIDKDKYALTCLVCHEGHGSQGDLMLVAGADENELCLCCHEQMRPGMFREHEVPPHPVGPLLNQEQIAAVHAVGAKLGPKGELICLSCHKMHDAESNRYILAFKDTESDVCLHCHLDKQNVNGTSHDLRTNFPDETNTHGLSVTEGGPCSSCHLFHNYARPLENHPIDPRGQCITCHQADRCGKAKLTSSVNHPKEYCIACHDPHNPLFGNYLVEPATKLCLKCHKEQAGLVRGPHDVTHNKNNLAWPAAAAKTEDTCLACHRPHGDQQTGLYRVAPLKSVDGVDGICLSCHPDAKSDADSKHALVHTTQVKVLPKQDKLPLIKSANDGYKVTCHTCHDPHRNLAEAPHLLRGEGIATSEELCLTCHPQVASIHTIGEAKERLQAAGFEADACKPCHLVHTYPQAIEDRYLWPKQLSAYPRLDRQISIADYYCVACHRTEGPVTPPATAFHPEVLMFNTTPPGEPGYFPLFDDQGMVNPQGSIACRTCHLTHGRTVPMEVQKTAEIMPARELRARKYHVRTFGATTVCNTCHGFNALRRFMYFHDPARRGGPIEGNGPR